MYLMPLQYLTWADVSHTVEFPTTPPALSRTRCIFIVALGLTTVIRLSLIKRTTPLGESLLAMVTLATRCRPRTAPPDALTSRTSKTSAFSLANTKLINN